MTKAFCLSSLIPPGFAVVSAASAGGATTIIVRSTASSSHCPGCSTPSRRVHSRYQRRVADLPLAGQPVRLLTTVRRFWCEAVRCGRRIFAERFADGILAPWSRRTGRLEGLVHHLGLALGGRPAASLASRLLLPVSDDTLLRVVRRRNSPVMPTPTIIGIDDWAWRRNHRCGTIICDLERRRPIRLCRIGRPPPRRLGWPSYRRSPSSCAITVARTRVPPRRHCRRCRSPSRSVQRR